MQTGKLLTIQEFARMGGHARARKYGKRQIRAWGKLGGRPKRTVPKKKGARAHES